MSSAQPLITAGLVFVDCDPLTKHATDFSSLNTTSRVDMLITAAINKTLLNTPLPDKSSVIPPYVSGAGRYFAYDRSHPNNTPDFSFVDSDGHVNKLIGFVNGAANPGDARSSFGGYIWKIDMTETHGRCHPKLKFQDISTIKWVQSKNRLQNSSSRSKNWCRKAV